MKSKEQKRMEAQIRQDVYNHLSHEEKIEKMIYAPGECLRQMRRFGLISKSAKPKRK